MSGADSVRIPGGWFGSVSSVLGYQTSRQSNQRRGRLPTWPSGVDEDNDVPPTLVAVNGIDSNTEEDDEEKEEQERRAKLQEDVILNELVESILVQPGVEDSPETEPLLVLSAVRLPSPEKHDQSLVLEKLVNRFLIFSGNGPYSLVLLASPSPHTPSTSLLISTYLSLPHSARKNLRRLYIVGGGRWVRFILHVFMTTLLSYKTRRKIFLCSKLSELASEMGEGFRVLDIPQECYLANSELEQTIEMPPSTVPHLKMFGETLEDLMGNEGGLGLPRVIKDALHVLETSGLDQVGIFRRSPSAATVKQLQDAYDRGHPINLAEYSDAPYLSASLLKSFLRSLPSPLIPPSIYHHVRSCPIVYPESASETTQLAVQHIKQHFLPALSEPTRQLLQHILKLLHQISAQSEVNLMTTTNLVIVIAPGVVGGQGFLQEELEMCRVPGTMRRSERPKEETQGNTIGGVLKILIDEYDSIYHQNFSERLVPVQGPASPLSVGVPIREPGASLRSLWDSQPISPTSPAFTQTFGSAKSSFSLSSPSIHSNRSMRSMRDGDSTIKRKPSAGTIGFRTAKARGRISEGQVTKDTTVMGLFAGASKETVNEESM